MKELALIAANHIVLVSRGEVGDTPVPMAELILVVGEKQYQMVGQTVAAAPVLETHRFFCTKPTLEEIRQHLAKIATELDDLKF